MNKFQKDVRDLNGKLINISILIDECTRDIEKCIASLQGLDPEPEDRLDYEEAVKAKKDDVVDAEDVGINIRSNKMVFGEDA